MKRELKCLVIAMTLLSCAATAAQTVDITWVRTFYYDSRYRVGWQGDSTATRNALAAAGYTALNADELKTWMDAHIADKKYSVVVFCQDTVPDTVAESMSSTCTLRKYLDAGGKIVWYADIPLYHQSNSSAVRTTWGTPGSTAVLGFHAASATWDTYNQATITPLGETWGLTQTWQSRRPTVPTVTPNLGILATDNAGNAAAWVKHYLPNDTFRGFVRLYDTTGQANAQDIMRVAEYVGLKAFHPQPTDGATDVPRDAVLSWRASPYAATHDVYVGTVFADVNTASRTDAKALLASKGQADTTFHPAGPFAYGQTYYWRVDEVNTPPSSAIFKGNLWSFTVEPHAYPIMFIGATASSAQADMGPQKTIDGSGLDRADLHGTEPTTMWMSGWAPPHWIQYQFDKVYKLHQLLVWNSNQQSESLLGFGARSVTVDYSTDGTMWTALAGVPELVRAPGTSGYAAHTTIDFGGVMAKYIKLTVNTNWGGVAPQTGLAEVRFTYIPVQARAPEPATAATGVSMDTTLNWRPGREAASHQVYFGTDPNAVAAGAVAARTVADPSYTPDALHLGTTYYWKVDEVNAVTYPGDVWSFTTQEYCVVDDFESYTDKVGHEVFSTWIGRFIDPSSGSAVGLTDAQNGTFCETTIIHGGKQSMPLAYDNTKPPYSSEAVRTFDPPWDWTASGIKSLSLWFRGVAGNGGQLYVKIDGIKVVYGGDAADLARAGWQRWNVDLSTVGKVSSIRSLTIGVEGRAKGVVYLDDIRLYPKAPEYIVPGTPPSTNLVAHYTFDEGSGTRVGDSSGRGNHGTADGNPQWVKGILGGAMAFDGVDDFVDCGNDASVTNVDSVSVAAWIKVSVLGRDHKIAGNQDGRTGGYKLSVYTNNKAEFEIRGSANAPTLNRTTPGGTVLRTDVWYHVVGVHEKGKALRTYVNGRLDRELLTTAVAGISTGALILGRERRGDSDARWWNGLMDDVCIYNRALSAAEVAELAGQIKP